MEDLFFSSAGRLNRSRFWLGSLGFGVGAMVLLALVLAVLWAVIPGTVDDDGMYSVNGLTAVPYLVVGVAYFVATIWAGICLGIKRYHDLDKSGAWLLVILIPFVGGLIYFVQAGCMRGTVGPNRYGPDPLSGLSFA